MYLRTNVHSTLAFNDKFAKDPVNLKNMHRNILEHENLNEIFSWQEERSLSKNLTMQYDKVIYMIEDTPDNRQLAKNKVTVYDYYDGTIKIKHNNRELPYRIFDKIQKVDQGEIVSNKRLGAVLNYIKNKQDEKDEARSASTPSKQHLGEISTAAIREKSKANQRLFQE